jgi:hypothetical protein
MWLTLVRKPEFVSKPIDELLQNFRPIFICQTKDMTVLGEDPNEMTFEERDETCYGRNHRYTIARIVRGRTSVAIYAYRADVAELPPGRRDFVLKTLASAPLEKAGATTQAAAANSAPSAAASP